MADCHSQEGAAGILNSKIGAQFQQRKADPLMKAEAQEARSSQEQTIPLLKITLMKLPEGRLRRMRSEVVELFPAQGTNTAIVVGLDLESRRSERKRREFRNRSGRQERNHHPFGPYIQTSDAGRSSQEDVGIGGQLRLPQDNFALAEVGDLECGYEMTFVCSRKPGERIQMAEQFQIRRACFMFIIQIYIYDRHPTPIPLNTETKCSLADGFYVLQRTKKMLSNNVQFAESVSKAELTNQ
jgi:hypothetical protein